MKPIDRCSLIRRLRELGFDGPFVGKRHEYMERGDQKVRIPNPHRGDISGELVGEILKQAGISREEWESVA